MHQIGVGVLGPVYRCFDPGRGRLVAVKAFHLDLTPERAETLARALEAVVAGLPVHPAIVTPVGAGLTDGVPYFAQSYVAAESLDVAIRNYAPASEETAGLCLSQLAAALDLAHGQDLCHGALHQRDVFVSPELAQVTGLGVVPALERVGLRGPLRRPYTAPEQIAGEDWGPAADRFALATLAFELLTGKRAAGAPMNIEPLASPAGADTIRLGRLFQAALADEPTARPGSATGFVDDLADALGWGGTLRFPTGPSAHAVPFGDSLGGEEGPETGMVSNRGATEMARAKRPTEQDAGSLDWTEHTLDRGESESLRVEPEYEPREPGDARPARGAASGFEELEPLFAEGEAAEDKPAPAEDDEAALINPVPPELVEAFSELEFEADVQEDEATLADGAWSESADEEGRPDNEPDAPETEEVELDVIQARYRGDGAASTAYSELDCSEEEGDANTPDPLPAYEPIHLDPPEALAEAAPDDDPDATLDLQGNEPIESVASSEPRVEGSVSPTPAGYRIPVAQNEEPAEEFFELEPEHSPLAASEHSANPPIPGAYEDYDEVEDDDVTAGAMPAAWKTEGRRLPWAVLAIFIMAIAFFVGFGWMSGGDSVADAAPPFASAGALSEVPLDEPVAAVPDALSLSEGDGQTFSEAAVETPSAPAVPSPELEPVAPSSPVPALRAARAAPEPAVVEGRLLVRSAPPGVNVVVDGEPRGQTPFALAGLAAGSYQLRLSMDGYELDERQVVISADDPIASLDATLTPLSETLSPETGQVGVGSIFVDTRPRGSEVWLDRQLVGETPMLIPNVSPGVHDVEFRQDGYRAWVTTVEVGPSGQARITASLDHAR